ncbi:MAG: Gfo/Idh/MocA family oxidoreductase, partial [Chloroflexi bacterium]|nr:Gfo/Idh/MocA family oxidoreductase [Chloroflexota bacterium]
ALAYRDSPDAELYAVCDADADLAARRAREWGARISLTDYRELLADPDLDAVEVLTPHHLHAEMAVAALAAGKHVSLQKPMALSVAEATQMVDAARRSGKIFRVLENFHFYEPHLRAKAIIESDEIGDPESIRIKVVGGTPIGGWEISEETKAWRADPARGGPPGQLFDAGHHQAALAYFFFGEFDAVHAFAAISDAQGKYLGGSPAMISWKHRGGNRYGSWQVTSSPEMQIRTKYYAGDDLLEITGTKGIVWVNRCTADLLGAPPVTVYRDGRLCNHNDVETDWGDSFRRGGLAFTDAIANGTPPGLSGSEGRHILATLFAVIASATDRRQVSVSELE